ncbi:MAG: hypothetical protein SFY70_00090 [Bacteroidia bacterium]|nr:hypothetical protein [Bacteroidia bacterium]
MRAVKLWLRRHLPVAWYHRLKYRGLAPKADALVGHTVLSGPFQGMRYAPSRAFNGHYGMLLGVYEHTVQTALAELHLPERPTLAIVGAAEGYYAVGMALRYPTSRVLAYELESWIHPTLRALAQANGVADRVVVRGAATPEGLAADFSADAPHFVFFDVEGAEASLADPMAIPQLGQATVLIELHPFVVPGIEATLRARFERTHTCHVLDERTPTWAEIRALLPTDLQAQAGPWVTQLLDENRVEPMRWLLFQPQP